MDIKCSIIISVLESYDVVNRQIQHFDRILPEDWELILMDDGSDPVIIDELAEKYPAAFSIVANRNNFFIFETNENKIPWHQPQARNEGAELANGEYLFFTDIDHVLTKEAIQSVNDSMPFHKMVFPRTWAVLNPDGRINQDTEVLKTYGLKDELIGKVTGHANTFAMPKEIFLQCPYLEKFQGFYGGDDVQQSKDYGMLARANGWQTLKGEMIYVYPDPRNNFEDFHGLRKHKIETGSYENYKLKV